MAKVKTPSEDVQAFIRDAFWYDQTHGRIEWLTPPLNGRSEQGECVGSVRRDGYRYIYVRGALLSALAVAAFMRDGRWPEDRVKPINGHKDDLRPENLKIGSSAAKARVAKARRAAAETAIDGDPFTRIPKAERGAILRDLDLSAKAGDSDPVFRRHAIINALDWLMPGGYRRKYDYRAHDLGTLEQFLTLFS